MSRLESATVGFVCLRDGDVGVLRDYEVTCLIGFMFVYECTDSLMGFVVFWGNYF